MEPQPQPQPEMPAAKSSSSTSESAPEQEPTPGPTPEPDPSPATASNSDKPRSGANSETTDTKQTEDRDAAGDAKGTLNAQGQAQKPVKPVKLTQQPDPSSIVPTVRRCNWESFVNRFSEDEPIHAIDALVAGDQLGKEMIEEASKRKDSGQFEAAEYEAKSRINMMHTDKTWVQRVRMQSPMLLRIFSRVTGYTWATNSYTFLHPFRYLIHHHEALKQELQRMETLESESQAQTLSDVSQLRCYIEFAESDLMPRYQFLKEDVPTPSSSCKIRFHELWYLFKLGDLIFMPDKTLNRWISEEMDGHVVWSPGISNESTMRQKIWRTWDAYLSPTNPSSPVNYEAEDSVFELDVYYLDYDGTAYSPIVHTFSISYFEGERDVRALDFFPLRYAKGAESLMEEHLRMGRLFTQRRNEWHMSYNGWTLTTHPTGWPILANPDSAVQHQVRPEYIDGEVIVDFNEAYNDNPTYKGKFSDHETWSYLNAPTTAVNAADLLVVWSDSNRTRIISGSHEVIITQDNTQQLERDGYLKIDRYLTPDRDLTIIPEGDDLALLPRRLFVYSLKDAKFVPINVEFLKSLNWRDDGFNQLQLQESHKQVIQSSVRSHLKRNSIQRQIEKDDSGTLFTQDFIQGKGRGLLIMLHGEPGTGKTSTAEAVAQRFRRPLLPLSCGDMSHPAYAERQLETVFRLSTLWDCILLLDEADVMLSARTSMDDLFRNSLVSVFLRRLEYYNGILFLTTNRIGKIDQAISSRLHLILHYKRLKQPEIEKVFRINIERLRQSERQQAEANNEQPLVVVESDILQFVSDHCAKHPAGKGAWNGRQIRNAFLIAAGMARDEAEQQESPSFQPQLRGSHFRQVEKLFEEYVQFRMRVLGKDDAQQALLNEERDDDFDGIPDEEKKPTWPAAGGHQQVDQQAQSLMSPSQGHFVKPAAPRQHPGMGAGFTMSPYGHEPQPATTWGMNVNSNRAYTAIPPGISIEQAQNVGRPSYMAVQNDSGQNPPPGGQTMGGYGQQQAPGPAMLMNNGQGMQYNATTQASAGFRQHSYTSDERIGEFPAQNPLDNTGSNSQRF